MKCERSSGGYAIDYHALQVMHEQTIKVLREGQFTAVVAAAFGANIQRLLELVKSFFRQPNESVL